MVVVLTAGKEGGREGGRAMMLLSAFVCARTRSWGQGGREGRREGFVVFDFFVRLINSKRERKRGETLREREEVKEKQSQRNLHT